MAEDGQVDLRVDVDFEGADAALAELEARARSFGSALMGALRGAIVDGRSLEDVLRGLAARLSEIGLSAGLAPLERLVSSTAANLTSGLGRLLPLAQGGIPGRVTPFAEGGIVGAPSLFAMPGGEIGLMGEAGAEAILPLARGADGRLGVASTGGQGAVQVTFNVTTPDAGSFRKSEAQLTAMLARAVARGGRGL
jgi:Phage-related minor tail protein